jgi:hypothetical protein
MSREGENSTGNSNSTSTTSSSSSSSNEEEENSDNNSSSEEFFDAEEPNTGTLIRFSKKILESPPNRVDLTTLTPAEIDSCASNNELFFVTPPQSGGNNNSTLMNASSVSMASILSKALHIIIILYICMDFTNILLYCRVKWKKKQRMTVVENG